MAFQVLCSYLHHRGCVCTQVYCLVGCCAGLLRVLMKRGRQNRSEHIVMVIH